MVEGDRDTVVVGQGSTGRQAVELVARLRPAVLLLQLDLPGGGGVEAVERIMSDTPTPVLVHAGDADTARQALAAGAVDVLVTPAASVGPAAEAVRRAVRTCSRVRVITHPRSRLRRAAEARAGGSAVRLVVIGASTGGPNAVLEVLRRLPAGLPSAVLVVQHMADGFVPGLACWLDALVPLPVVVGRPGERLLPGVVTVAPTGADFVVRDRSLTTAAAPPGTGQHHVPSIDRTLTSVADVLGGAAVGVLLTGMGRDGAAGLRRLRQSSGHTIAQDEPSSTVYGMPAAAMALDAVDRQLPLTEIGDAVLAAVCGLGAGRDRAS